MLITGITVISVVGIGVLIYNKLRVKYWKFSDNYWGVDESSKLGFIGDSKPPFKEGDKINVSQNSGAKYNQYDGTTTVSSVLKTDKGWVVFVPKAYKGASPENGGVIKGLKK